MSGVCPSGAVAHPRRSFVVVAPPPRHPTGVLARGLWLSASPTPLQFRQQGVREREYATASAPSSSVVVVMSFTSHMCVPRV